ncbi:RES family NAD+ phosphorylase [Leclercia sp. CFBP8987]|uniref:RES family NAD+ phosphorylase n=1 Tax=Leclercia sp. CFBP8987 TaxID=3096525 RepID=UPI002A6AE98C|nr:RES family NAD+ phosphorylase [Leclercia sp. CFBP8987]MDY0921856.1 RES family NAD+ phosphorylase [Leclercia sp. CFBP8987]
MIHPEIPRTALIPFKGYRLLHTKYPAIYVFEDVATPEEFDVLYDIQKLTNPRLSQEVGNLDLLPREEWVLGIRGAHYAMAAFTHINPDGSRFSNGDFGVYYLGDSQETALAEVVYHCQRYWRNVPELKFERFEYRCLETELSSSSFVDITGLPDTHPWYHPTDYRESQQLGASLRVAGETGVTYRSVRHRDGICWALLTPKTITSIIQTSLHQIIWNKGMVSIGLVTPT